MYGMLFYVVMVVFEVVSIADCGFWGAHVSVVAETGYAGGDRGDIDYGRCLHPD